MQPQLAFVVFASCLAGIIATQEGRSSEDRTYSRHELAAEWPLWPEGRVPYPRSHTRFEDPSFFDRPNLYTWGCFNVSLEFALPQWKKDYIGSFPSNKYGPQEPGEQPGWQFYYNVTTPLLVPMVVDAESPGRTNASIIIAPGGGLEFLAWDMDGIPVAEWLNSIGVSAFVLRYRVPQPRSRDFLQACNISEEAEECLVAFYDVLRALRMVKHRAPQLGLDPDKVGCLGFSAGGVLCSVLLENIAARGYLRVDEADDESFHWGFSMPIFPGVGDLFPVGGYNLGPGLPPHFVAMSADDPMVPVGSVYSYFKDLYRVAPAGSELHLFANGGHGNANCVTVIAAFKKWNHTFVDYCEWVVYAEAFLKNKIVGVWPPYNLSFAKPPSLPGDHAQLDALPIVVLVASTAAGALLAATLVMGAGSLGKPRSG